jgi:3-oxoacyl-[acyl-carrier-protein] synthase II
LNISGTKSMTGHLLGAAGAVEAILSIKAIQDSIVPPTINTNVVEPEFVNKLNLTLTKAEYKEINFAMNNTFGFGGHIATTIFKKFSM